MSGTYSLKKEDIKKYSDASSVVYKNLFGPFIEKNNLIIIPDGLLSVISADALVVTPKNTATSYNNLDYAIFHHNISYAYSTSIYCKGRGIKKNKIENVLAFSYSDGIGGPSIALRNQQADLPGTFKELEALSRLFKNVKRFTNEQASKINFIRNTSGSDIIHLGVHGVGDEEVEDNARLIFRKDSLNDPELYAYEIYNLNLTAGLVVLSACESGLGRNQRGEGMFSIARAFTYAGCPASVMSLWKARDVFTADVMVQFYEHIHKGESVSNALRNAKLQFLKDADGPTAHPANWAAFVLNGHDMDFGQKANFRYAWYAVAALLLAILTTYMIRRNRAIRPPG
jgi:CHAT domain-containing protein